jgi:hypothetical protein
VDSATVDNPNGSGAVLQLRARGRSFATIADALGYADAQGARAAFLDAVRALPEPARRSSITNELRRLDQLAARIAAKPLEDAERARLLRAVDRMRDQINGLGPR